MLCYLYNLLFRSKPAIKPAFKVEHIDLKGAILYIDRFSATTYTKKMRAELELSELKGCDDVDPREKDHGDHWLSLVLTALERDLTNVNGNVKLSDLDDWIERLDELEDQVDGDSGLDALLAVEAEIMGKLFPTPEHLVSLVSRYLSYKEQPATSLFKPGDKPGNQAIYERTAVTELTIRYLSLVRRGYVNRARRSSSSSSTTETAPKQKDNETNPIEEVEWPELSEIFQSARFRRDNPVLLPLYPELRANLSVPAKPKAPIRTHLNLIDAFDWFERYMSVELASEKRKEMLNHSIASVELMMRFVADSLDSDRRKGNLFKLDHSLDWIRDTADFMDKYMTSRKREPVVGEDGYAVLADQIEHFRRVLTHNSALLRGRVVSGMVDELKALSRYVGYFKKLMFGYYCSGVTADPMPKQTFDEFGALNQAFERLINTVVKLEPVPASLDRSLQVPWPGLNLDALL